MLFEVQQLEDNYSVEQFVVTVPSTTVPQIFPVGIRADLNVSKIFI